MSIITVCIYTVYPGILLQKGKKIMSPYVKCNHQLELPFCFVILYYPQRVAAYIPQMHELKRDVKSRKCGLWVNTFVISWQMNTLTLNYLHKLWVTDEKWPKSAAEQQITNFLLYFDHLSLFSSPLVYSFGSLCFNPPRFSWRPLLSISESRQSAIYRDLFHPSFYPSLPVLAAQFNLFTAVCFHRVYVMRPFIMFNKHKDI